MASGVTKARHSVTTLSWLWHLPRAVISSQICSGQAGSALWRRPRPAPGSQVAQPPERVCFSLGAEPGLCAGLSGRSLVCLSQRGPDWGGAENVGSTFFNSVIHKPVGWWSSAMTGLV